MNAGLALVRGYLHLNGYFTLTDFPILRQEGRQQARVVTDVDILALRLPHASRVVARGRPGLSDDLTMGVDPRLDIPEDWLDMIIAEVKEGQPRVNSAFRSRETLESVISRLGACPPARVAGTVSQLREHGSADVGLGGVAPCRIRLMAFGDGEPGDRHGYTVFQLRHVADFVRQHFKRYRKILHPVDVADPALGILHLLEKLS